MQNGAMTSAPPLQLLLQTTGIYRVLTGTGQHVGNLKYIGGSWKFKAIGYDVSGQVIPGGGPLTDRHNLVFATLQEAEICMVLV